MNSTILTAGFFKQCSCFLEAEREGKFVAPNPVKKANGWQNNGENSCLLQAIVRPKEQKIKQWVGSA